MNQTGTPRSLARREQEHHRSCRQRQERSAVREVPPAEEPVESAVKKRQFERSHRPEERDECAARASAEEG